MLPRLLLLPLPPRPARAIHQMVSRSNDSCCCCCCKHVVSGNNSTTCPLSQEAQPAELPGLYYQNAGGSLPRQESVVAYKDLKTFYPGLTYYFDSVRVASYGYDPVAQVSGVSTHACASG